MNYVIKQNLNTFSAISFTQIMFFGPIKYISNQHLNIFFKDDIFGDLKILLNNFWVREESMMEIRK